MKEQRGETMKGKCKTTSWIVHGLCIFSFTSMPSLSVTEGAAAEKKVFHWKVSSYTNPGNKSLGMAQLWWADQVEKRSEGQIKLKMYWLDELCGAKEMMMAAKSRLAEVVTHVPSYTPGETPIWNAAYLPFLGAQRLDHCVAIYNRLGKESKPFVEELNKFNCIFGGAFDNFGYNLMGKKPVRSTADFKGVRIRVVPDLGEIIKQFGAVPMSVPVTEMYSALDTGIVDLVAHSRLTFHAYKVDEISKYLILGMDMAALPAFYYINKNAFHELPDNLKKAVQSVIDDYPAHMWDFQNDPQRVQEADKVLKDRNIEVIYFPKTERAKLESKAEGVWEAWAKRSGNYENAKQAISDYIRIRDEVVAKYPQGMPGIKYK
jgi:TRAP-type C4-dicarboxylate transport system substrate-binding protein